LQGVISLTLVSVSVPEGFRLAVTPQVVSYRACIVQSSRSSRPSLGSSTRNSKVVTPTSPINASDPTGRKIGRRPARDGTAPRPLEPSQAEPPRPLPPSELLRIGKTSLKRLERAQVGLVRASLQPGLLNRAIRTMQRTVGQAWVRAVTSRLRHVHGLNRLPPWDPSASIVCVANHRSFFDLFVTTAELVAHGLPQRILFPVRSNFFYDHPLGPAVNGAMSFFAMYPPIFRDPKRAALNLASLDEIAGLLQHGGFFVGMHPEGMRNRIGDPYTLLPGRGGVGRVIRKAAATGLDEASGTVRPGVRATIVLPVFVNGLGNDFVKQVTDGLTGRGERIHMVFGEPIDFGDLLHAPETPRTYRAIAERCVDVLTSLGHEERRLRAAQPPHPEHSRGHGRR
jgi:1-acyl-sn-glycerol-3-phosphate acyltransferase